MKVEQIAAGAWTPGTWAHGETHAIAAWLGDGDDGAIVARLSVATIDAAGPFSVFAGCTRWLAVLDDGGGLALAIDGGAPRSLATGDAIRFEGDAAVIATPVRRATVLNVIVQHALAWSARPIAAAHELAAPPGVLAIFATTPLAVEAAGQCVTLAPRATAIVTAATPIHARIGAGAGFVVELGVGPTHRRR